VAEFTEFHVFFVSLQNFSSSAVTFSNISRIIKTAFVRITPEHSWTCASNENSEHQRKTCILLRIAIYLFSYRSLARQQFAYVRPREGSL
jgi:hypothetical protein